MNDRDFDDIQERVAYVWKTFLERAREFDKVIDGWEYKNVTIYAVVFLMLIAPSCSDDRTITIETSHINGDGEKVESVVKELSSTDDISVAKAKALLINVETPKLTSLPNGYKVITDGKEFAWIDEDDYRTIHTYDTHKDAVEGAISFHNAKNKAKIQNWVTIGSGV
jgi:hypothetical protein